MGRSRKVLTDMDRECRRKTGERIEALKKKLGYNTVSLAKKLNVSDSAMRNYIKGRKALDPGVASELRKLSGGIIELYWQGMTDAETWLQYYAECENAADEAVAEYAAAEKAEREKLETFFSVCGYQYRDLSNNPEYVFAGSGFSDQEVDGQRPYILTDTIGTVSKGANFSKAEIEGLLTQIRDVVGYACYKKAIQK